jgi:hypothetical protein
LERAKNVIEEVCLMFSRGGSRKERVEYRQRKAGSLDLFLASHEDKDVTRWMPQMHSHGLLHSSFHIILLRQNALHFNDHPMACLNLASCYNCNDKVTATTIN